MIRQDVFPALIAVSAPNTTAAENLSPNPLTPDAHQIHSARIILTEDRVMVATDGATGPQVVFSQTIDPDSHYKNPDRRGLSYVTTTSGQAVAFIRDDTCGCGSRLRSWSPMRFITSSQDPTE